MSKIVFGTGSDPILPDVSLTLGGREYSLCFDMNAIATVEATTGLNLLTTVMGEKSFTSVRALVWAAVLRDAPDVTIEAIGKCIRPANIGTCYEAVQAAWFGSAPEPEEDAPAGEDQAPLPPPAGDGTGASPATT